MLKILQARFQQYMNQEIPDVQARFRKDSGTRDQIAKIPLDHRKSKIIPEKKFYFCFIDYAKVLDCVDQKNCGKFLKRWEYQTMLLASW